MYCLIQNIIGWIYINLCWTSSYTPLQHHTDIAHRCCCCLRASCRCVWCLPLEDQGDTVVLQLLQGAPHRESLPGKSENEMSPWRTVEWFGPPNMRSSNREEKRGRCQLMALFSFGFNERLQKRKFSSKGVRWLPRVEHVHDSMCVQLCAGKNS